MKKYINKKNFIGLVIECVFNCLKYIIFNVIFVIMIYIVCVVIEVVRVVNGTQSKEKITSAVSEVDMVVVSSAQF